METFAELLRRHRGARSLTQEELAERARLSTNAVSALERGERRRPYPHTVRVLADALELDDRDRAALRRAASPDGLRDRPGQRPGGSSGVAPGVLVPVPAGPVVGRDGDVERVVGLVCRPVRRMITLTGPGGVGKTTLALAVAARVAGEFPGGVVFVDLADLVDPAEVLPTIATALGTPGPEQPVAAPVLAPVLAGRRVLLVLDNLERLLACGPDLAQLVALSPELVLLATSRAPLRVRPEQEVRVAPLPADAAALLFRDRAAAAGVPLDPGPETAAAVDALCARCDGLPLAVELAAAAAVVLGPAALLARLDALPATAPRDLPARQRSMTATLAWSHELLSAPARALLARLSVCSGFSVALAEEVGGDPGTDRDEVLSALAELVEHSLVTRVDDVEGTERFRLLEPVRQDAAARLDPVARAGARAGLVRAMLDLAHGLADDLDGPDQVPALNLLQADRNNLREAYDQLVRDDRVDDAADLFAAVSPFLVVRGPIRRDLVESERLRGRPMRDVTRARWLLAKATLWSTVGDPVTARGFAEDAVSLAERIGDEDVAAHAAALAAWAAAFTGDLAAARRGVERARAHGAADGTGDTRAMFTLATSTLATNEGELDEADRLLREGAVATRGLGPFAQAVLLFTRGMLAASRGDARAGASLLGRAVLLFLEVRSVNLTAFAVTELAAVAVRLGDLETGARLFGAAGPYLAEVEAEPAFRDTHRAAEAELARARSGLGEAAFTAAWKAGRNATADDIATTAVTYVRELPP